MIVRRRAGVTHRDAELLRPSRDYVVYGILADVPPQFLVYEDEEFSFPIFVSSEILDIVENKVSSHWRYSAPLAASEVHASRPPVISFAGMIDDRLFYQALVDGDRGAMAIWTQAKQLIDAEYRSR